MTSTDITLSQLKEDAIRKANPKKNHTNEGAERTPEKS